MTERTLPLVEAARLLGVTVEGLRKRCQRKQIEAYRGNDGRWLVTLDTSSLGLDTSNPVQESGRIADQDKLVNVLMDMLDAERAEKSKLLDLVGSLAGRLEEAGRLTGTVDRLTAERDHAREERDQVREQMAELKTLVGQLVGKLDTAEDVRRQVEDLRTSTGKALIGLQRALREPAS